MGKKVLVVDNHPVILKFMSSLLEKRGDEIVTAPDGLSALQVLETFSPDVAFVDLVMPNIGGEKLCRIMRRTPGAADAYIVVLSAIAAEGRVDHSAFGADACIAKGPFPTMARHVLKVMERYDQTGRPAPDPEVIGIQGLHGRVIIEELLSVKRHFEVVLDHLSEGILELTPDEKIVFANPAAVRVLGTTEEELLGRSLTDHFQPPYGQKLKDLLQNSRGSRDLGIDDSALVFNEKLLVPDVIRLRETKGESSIVILKDVTRQKHMEAKLFEAQKMEAIGTLAGGIAHQFNNALAVIVGNMEFIKIGFPEKGDMARYLEPIREAVQRMAQLNDHLLAYARGGKYQPKTLSLNRFLMDTLPLLKPSLKPGVVLETEFEEGETLVDVDMSQMQMVLSAVLANASEAIEGQGKIRIECRDMRIAPNAPPGAFPLGPGAYVCLTVQDNGRGMDEETRKRIFEPFFTTKFQGRGMGMPAVYGVVKNHGGWISVDSVLGQGTTVRIYLPAAKGREPAQPRAETHKPQQRGVILLIEDEPMVMQVNRVLLESLGYRVLAADTGDRALQTARAEKGSIDLAILDVVLPDMEARELYSLLKEARPLLKVLVCSGYSIHSPVQEILDLGAQGFLQKPFTLKQLSAELERVMGRERETAV